MLLQTSVGGAVFVIFAFTLLIASLNRLPVLRLLLPVGRDVGGQGRGRGRRGAGRGRRGRGPVGGGGGGDPRPVGAVGGRRLGGAAAVQLGAAEAGAAALDAARRAGRRSRAGRGAGPARKQSGKLGMTLGWLWVVFPLIPLPENFPKLQYSVTTVQYLLVHPLF